MIKLMIGVILGSIAAHLINYQVQASVEPSATPQINITGAENKCTYQKFDGWTLQTCFLEDK